MRLSVLLFFFIPLSVVAFLSTLASGSIGSLSGWGFPLQWKVGGCVYLNGGLTCAEEFDNLLFFASDFAFFLLVDYAAILAGYRLVPHIVERVAVLGPRGDLFAVLFGTAITLATGLVSSGQLVSPGGFSGLNYGFPLVWKSSLASCPPPCVQANGTYYDWINVVGDVLFYTTACSLGLSYWLRKLPVVQRLKIHLRSRRILGLLALAVVALSAGNYAYDSVYGTGNHWIGYGRLVMDHYSFQNPNVVTIWLNNIGPGTVTLTTLYLKNANGYGPVALYQLGMTIDQGTLGMISENTTSQGLQLTQSGTYSAQIVTSHNVETSFTITWT